MGDTCCYFFSMGAVKNEIESKIPNIYVKSIMIGYDMAEDEIRGFIGNANDEVDQVCQMLKSDPKLQHGFNAVGFSQGGQFLRGYVERCNDPPVHNLITMGGQHQGVADIPNCVTVNETICTYVEDLLAFGAYEYYVQESIIQAQYFKDPMEIPNYLASSIYIADINNEKQVKNETYKQNLITLNQFVMFKFEDDTVVVPKESEWFEFFEEGSTSIIVPLEKSVLYQEDWIGLRTLNEAGKLKFLTVPNAEHMQFSLPWFSQNVITPFLNVSIQSPLYK
eukprot:TRINITY_DN4980_c0_g1_i1.p1 TRINITY_DN4980_c0_g1~~TRINITY_DN4980_c0_g1_i1.p1  ORF type:complete len:319 (+),score=42.96 TRINITY_DN4980_c0_g1_i1:122-958(+)